MAKPKKTSKAKSSVKSSSKKPAPKAKSAPKRAAPAKSGSGGGGSSKHADVRKLLATLPPISDNERAGFAAQSPDDKADALGSKTQSASVYKEALGFAHVIDKTLHDHPELVHYTAERLTFFAESILALGLARDSQSAGGDAASSARVSLEQAKTEALAVRRRLLHMLELLAMNSDGEHLALDDARGDTSTVTAIIDSLNALARHADSWLRRTDAESKALCAGYRLTRGHVDQAWAAAAALDSASDVAAGKRKGGGRDSASVNRAEGRVLIEMKIAMHAFDFASEENKLVPKLVPGGGTRHVLVSAVKRGKGASSNGATAGATAAPH